MTPPSTLPPPIDLTLNVSVGTIKDDWLESTIARMYIRPSRHVTVPWMHTCAVFGVSPGVVSAHTTRVGSFTALRDEKEDRKIKTLFFCDRFKLRERGLLKQNPPILNGETYLPLYSFDKTLFV